MKRSLDRESFKHRLDTMINKLREEIATGQRKPGDFLPSEMNLAKMFGLSNLSVRAGLAVLVEEGLVDKIPRVGNKISASVKPQTNMITLRLGTHSTIERDIELTSLLQAFEQLHPDVRIEIIPLPNLRYFKIVKQYITNGMLDAFTMSQRDFCDFHEHDGLSLLETFEPDAETYPFVNKAYTRNEQLYAKPIAFSPLVLLYNKKHFGALGIGEPDSSWTWNDVMRYAEQLEVPQERLGFYFHLLSLNRWPIFLLQNGVRFEREPGGRLLYDRDKFIEAIRTCRDLLHKRNMSPAYLSENDSDAEELFLKEKVSMIVTSYFILNKLRNAPFPFDIAPLPYMDEPKSMLLTLGLAVNSASQVKPAALKLAEFIASRQAQQIIRTTSLSLPARKGAAEWIKEDTRVSEPYRFHMYREIIPTFRLYSDMQLSLSELIELGVILKLYWSHMEEEDSICSRVEKIGCV